MTSPPFQPGDLVLLTGKGCDRPTVELMAIWTVIQLRENQVIVKFEAKQQTVEGIEDLGTRNFPVNWLVLYRRGERSPVDKVDRDEDF